ncbi:Endoglucanase-4 [Penicillium rolfsii]|nr:Endoglucanase-4 [Penicillium rolfsii]
MSFSKIAGVILGSAALVAGHGYVSGAVVDGTYYGGYLITQYPYESSPPETIGWSDTATDLGFVDGSSYASSDIICHKNAKPGAISAPVKAGGSVELQWSEWPESHHGPVISYLANCNGDCSSVDKTTLKFFKIDEGGLIDDSSVPGTWASDNLIKNNNSRTITIPSSIAAGNYVLRHEIIALHSAGNTNGAQNYPQCFNLKVTGGGSDAPTGTLGTALYKDTDPGILVNIYQSLSSYTIPGPALYTGAASSSGSTTTAASVAATTTAAAAETTAAASSTVASVGVISSASPVSVTPSAIPTGSPTFSIPHPNSSRVPRPSSHSRRPGHGHGHGHGVAPSGRPQPSGGENQASVTDYATATEYATATATAQFTDPPVVQTPSADDTVTVTASAGGQSAASSIPAGGSSSSGSSSSGSSTTGSSSGSSSSGSSSSASSSYNSSDWSSYLSSLSADQFLNMLRETMKWLVSDQKVHARDLTV